MAFEDQKPKIDYPCDWTYKIIGKDESMIRTAIESLRENTGRIIKATPSTGGKYISITLQVNLEDESQRQDIYQKLAASDAIKMVF